MDKKQKWMQRFVILMPHRDARKLLEEMRAKLFSIGFHGAFSFPPAAPLAMVSKAFSREELKELARNIRGLTKENDGKITSGGAAVIKCPDKRSFFGPRLDLPIDDRVFPESTKTKVLYTLSPPILCAALIDQESAVEPGQMLCLSFRAAALANLSIRPLGSGEAGYSFEWRISPLVWLPGLGKGPYTQ